ncbi:MAG: hypothetical protein QCH96_07870, partial [Candidatus Thermoplasmatota archaeon]|nr:hypothetical protein [Candidatus Thermoplasmatota archaeon]
EVRAKACDERGYESEWSEYHEFISPLMKKNVMDTFVINMAAPRHECRSFLFTSGPIWKLQQCLMMFVQVFGP